MSYIDKNLMPNESIVFKSHLHWFVFVSPVVWLFSSFILFASVPILLVLTIPMFIISSFSSFTKYVSSEFAVTNKRLIIKTGLIRRDTVELLLTKVEGLQVNQGIFGRMFNFGTITVSGTGGSKNPYNKIAQPLKFRAHVQDQSSDIELKKAA